MMKTFWLVSAIVWALLLFACLVSGLIEKTGTDYSQAAYYLIWMFFASWNLDRAKEREDSECEND